MRSPLADGYPPVPYVYPPMADRKLIETKKGLSVMESPFSETVTRMGSTQKYRCWLIIRDLQNHPIKKANFSIKLIQRTLLFCRCKGRQKVR